MKRMVYVVAVAALFVCSVQAFRCPTKKIPVFARKKDLADTKEPVTVTITTFQGETISESTFFKNTTGYFVKKLYFCFTEQSPINRIEATYKGETFKASHDVPHLDGQYGANLVIDTANKQIEIIYKKPTLPTIWARVELPYNSGSWEIASGNRELTKTTAQSKFPEKYGLIMENNLDAAHNNTKVNTIEIYKDQDIRISARRENNTTPTYTLIEKKLVQQAGDNPVLIINDDGTASIVSAEQNKTVDALVQLPKNSGDWLIVSGNPKLTRSEARSHREQEEGLADWGQFNSEKTTGKIKVYKNKEIRIYAEKISDDKISEARTA